MAGTLGGSTGNEQRFVQLPSGISVPASMWAGPSGNIADVDSSSMLYVNNGALDSSQDKVSLESTRATTVYHVSSPALDATSTSSTAILYIQGAQNLVERLLGLRIWATATAAADLQVVLRRATAIPVGGTAVALTGHTLDVNDAASSAAIAYYTAKPGARADTTLFAFYGSIPAANTHPKNPIDLVLPPVSDVKDLILRGTGDVFTVYLGSIPAGFACNAITVVLTEAAS